MIKDSYLKKIGFTAKYVSFTFLFTILFSAKKKISFILNGYFASGGYDLPPSFRDFLSPTQFSSSWKLQNLNHNSALYIKVWSERATSAYLLEYFWHDVSRQFLYALVSSKNENCGWQFFLLAQPTLSKLELTDDHNDL